MTRRSQITKWSFDGKIEIEVEEEGYSLKYRDATLLLFLYVKAVRYAEDEKKGKKETEIDGRSGLTADVYLDQRTSFCQLKFFRE